jgi:hypothetical protein
MRYLTGLSPVGFAWQLHEDDWVPLRSFSGHLDGREVTFLHSSARCRVRNLLNHLGPEPAPQEPDCK